MAVLIENADLVKNREEIIRFFHDHLTDQSDDARFDWLYSQNPWGFPRAWISRDRDTGETIGVAAAFPRRVWADQSSADVWVLGDFCIAPESRTLGPALKLQRLSLDSLTTGSACYDFPSDGMMAIYRRMGGVTASRQVRMAKLFRLDSKLRNVIPSEGVARAASAVGNLALKLKNRAAKGYDHLQVTLKTDNFSDEFTEFDVRSRPLSGVRGVRSAEFLNWRYRRHPHRSYQTMVAREADRIAGYAVIEANGRESVIVDIRYDDEHSLWGLLRGLNQLFVESGVELVSVPVMENAAIVSYLKQDGYYPRESCPVVVCKAGSGGQPDIRNVERWDLMNGDRES